jgi:polyphosphate glucokinase
MRYKAKCDGSRERQADTQEPRAPDPSREDLVMATHTTKSAIGIDIGGTGVKGATVALDTGELTMERIRLLTPEPSTPEAVAEVVTEVLGQIGAEGPVGLTLPSVVTDGLVRTAANIDPSWIGVNAVELFGKATGRPVAVLNDADAAGTAEVRFGAGAGRSGLVIVVTLGTGIGSGMFVDGKLVANTELGHLHLHHGDAEHYAADSARERDGLSWEEYAHRLKQYLELVQSLFWPNLIIIGGGISKKSDRYLPHIKIDTEVVPATLLNDAGIVGAAMFAPVG